jgi:hypothetical protein
VWFVEGLYNLIACGYVQSRGRWKEVEQDCRYSSSSRQKSEQALNPYKRGHSIWRTVYPKGTKEDTLAS